MGNVVIIGAQWGDEGKGKVVDLLSNDIDMVVRFQGGNNAGHTIIVNGKKTILRLVPSGILHPGKVCLIGNGVVLNPLGFVEEIDALAAQGIDVSPQRLKISNRTHLIMPYHQALDLAREKHLDANKIGTTGRGIGPCYEDKVGRVGIHACDLSDPDLLREKIKGALLEKNALFTALYGVKTMSVDEVFDAIYATAARVTPYLADVPAYLHTAWKEGKKAMFEGAQGVHLDVDHGTYPFVTSSNTVSSSASSGTGVAPSRLDRIIGISKAYVTRVGSGPFPTELADETGKFLSRVGNEFGAVTGRPRRCGWQDAVVLRESVRLNGFTDIAMTKLDVLTGLDEVKICTAYEYKGKRIAYPPQESGALAFVTPVYETLPGWKEDLSTCTTWASLPPTTRAFVERMETLLEVPVSIISVGADRNQTIVR